QRYGTEGFDLHKTVMPIYWFSVKNWQTDENGETEAIIYRRNLLGAMHPNVNCAIGAIPPNKSPDEDFVNHYAARMKEGIEIESESGNIKLTLDMAGSSRTHGHYVFTDGNLGEIYFGSEPMYRINYGSILLTECKKLISRKMRIVVVDEEDTDIIVPTIETERLANYCGDCHGKVSAELAQILTEGVDDSWATEKRPIQIRVGIPNQYCWKGTIATVKGGLPKVTDPDDSAFTLAEAQKYDLLLPLSGFKGKKPAAGTVITETVYVGTVALGEHRLAKGSQMLWAWYSWDAVSEDIMPRTLAECQELVEAFDSPKAMAKILGNEYRNKLDFDFSGSLGEEEDIEDGEGAEATADEQFEDPLVKVLNSDKAGALLTHPWVVGRMTDRLAKRWKRLAIAGAVEFVSLLGQPLEMGEDKFLTREVTAGERLMFRNPILHYDYIRVLDNVIDRASENNVGATKSLKGAAFMSHATAAKFGGDFDGDWFQAKEREYEGIVADDDNIMWETKNFHSIYGPPPPVEKLGKQAIPGELEIVAIRSMDNKTGLISNLIQNAKANGTIHRKVAILNFDYRTGEYLPGFQRMTVLQFLSQAMQNEVDRLKNNIYTHENGIDTCRNTIFSGVQQAPWLVDRAYKKDWIYKTAPIPTKYEDGTEGTDTVSKMIAAVNKIWKPYGINAKHVGDFENLFPNARDVPKPYDEDMIEWARSINRWYGPAMAKAGRLGMDEPYWFEAVDGSKHEMSLEDLKKERLRQMRVIREEARDYRRTIDRRIEVTRKNIQRVKELLNVSDISDVPFNNLPLKYQQFFRQAASQQPVTLITDDSTWDIMSDGTNWRVLDSMDWAAAFWHACHHWGASDETTGGLVFLLFADEIVATTKTAKLNTLKVISVQNFKLAHIAWGDYDAVPVKNANKVHAIKAIKEGNPYQLYYPSASLYERLPENKRHLCNVVQMYVEGQEGERPNGLFIRSTPDKNWTEFAVPGRGEINFPKPYELCAAKIYSYKIQYFKDNPFNKKYLTTSATILWYYIRPEDWPLERF
ncbi:MAG: hypothetical protein WBA93_09970, partial [Microcoleaceae cyanobacterium]